MPHLVPERSLHEMVVTGSGTTLRWFRESFAPGSSYEQLIAEAAEVEPGSEGLLCFPYLEGMTVPVQDDSARAVFHGNQIKADVMGRALTPSLRAEAPALGATLLAGTGAGLFPSLPDAVRRFTRLAPTVEPRPPAVATYAELQKEWGAVAERVFPDPAGRLVLAP